MSAEENKNKKTSIAPPERRFGAAKTVISFCLLLAAAVAALYFAMQQSDEYVDSLAVAEASTPAGNNAPTAAPEASPTPSPTMPSPTPTPVHERAPVGLQEHELFDRGFVLSAYPGVFSEAFDLTITFPSMPDASIYFTIDGNAPQAGDDRYVLRRGNQIQVSGRVPEDGRLSIEDRTANWRDTVLTHYSDIWDRHLDVRPAVEAEILQGTAFRFQAFYEGEPVSEIITASYFVIPDAYQRFNGRPIVSVTAPYDDFVYIYSHAYRRDPTTRRRVFNYEFFDHVSGEYERMFNLPGSSSLGGNSTRANPQRTINVHLARGQLDGVITYPVFEGLYELYRFRLWNGGNAQFWDHMRDPFVQTASANMHVPMADFTLAIKFINGEYWGFTSIREHTNNDFHTYTRLGIDRGNVVILSTNNGVLNEEESWVFSKEVDEGPEEVGLELYRQLIDFISDSDFAEDYIRERFFAEFFCQDNFIDYLITQTFFHNRDWPHHNVRLFRAIEPDLDSGNPFNDGRWRFMLHDLDFAPHPVGNRPDEDETRHDASRFRTLYRTPSSVDRGLVSQLNRSFAVFNNPAFASDFVERALYLLENDFHTDTLIALHDEFLALYRPLMPEMYNRFAMRGTVERSVDRFNYHTDFLRFFIENREYYYRQQLQHLLDRLED
ncbi:MAG: CotH kinase family protein [Defluviitaleaceae bacterium]|nr:CotH kinase family protein [Defluviitaleaceae bacterium]